VTPTPGDPPGAGETWMEEGCATFDASRVYLELQTNSERETSALVELGSGDKHCIEFDKAATPRIRPTTGKLVYELTHSMGGHSVWEFVPDAMTWNADDEVWEMPEDWAANDQKIDTAVCDPRGVWDVMIEPDSGRIIFYCAGTDTPRGWFAEGGDPVLGDGFELLALGAAGRKLAATTPDSTTPMIIDGAGTELPVVGVSLASPLAIRASGEGFRVAVRALSGGDDIELWQIAKSGQATLVGTYAPVPPETQQSPAPMYARYALDADDNLYAFGRDTTTISTDTVIKRVLAPGASEIVYDEDDEPMQDFAVTPPAVGYQIRNGDSINNTFVTGP
jgi:hypothetical protein